MAAEKAARLAREARELEAERRELEAAARCPSPSVPAAGAFTSGQLRAQGKRPLLLKPAILK